MPYDSNDYFDEEKEIENLISKTKSIRESHLIRRDPVLGVEGATA